MAARFIPTCIGEHAANQSNNEGESEAQFSISSHRSSSQQYGNSRNRQPCLFGEYP